MMGYRAGMGRFDRPADPKINDANWLRLFSDILRSEYRHREADLCEHCADKLDFLQFCFRGAMVCCVVLFLAGWFLLLAAIGKWGAP